MEKEVYELILTGGAVGVLYVIYLIIKVMFGKKNGQTIALNKISNNDLNHIYSEMLHQTEQHNEQIKLLTKIATILEERK